MKITYELNESDLPLGYKDLQKLYMDKNGFLIPNVKVILNDNVHVTVNSLGCKGEELNGKDKIMAFFGDSTTMGYGQYSWVDYVDIPGFENLNAGVEGYSMEQCIKNLYRLSDKVRFDFIVVYNGWHNIIYNDTNESYWESILSEYTIFADSVAYVNIATCLTDDFRTQKIDDYITGYNSIGQKINNFAFWGDIKPTKENINKILDNIHRYNNFLRNFCLENNFLYIDLYNFLLPGKGEDITKNFFDICHFRNNLYPKVGAFVSDEINNFFKQNNKTDCKKQKPDNIVFKEKTHKEKQNKMNKNIYPLW